MDHLGTYSTLYQSAKQDVSINRVKSRSKIYKDTIKFVFGLYTVN